MTTLFLYRTQLKATLLGSFRERGALPVPAKLLLKAILNYIGKRKE